MGSSDLETSNLTEGDEPGRGRRGVVLTSLFCLLVAVALWVLGAAPLPSSLVVSFSIGWSIQGLFILLRARLEPRLGIPLSSALITMTGLLAGLLFSATVLYGDPLLFLLDSPGTLIVAVVLGIVGYLVVNTRERLLRSRLELAQLEQARAEQAQRLAVTELKLLQAQIEPHFLFNTLSNIQSLIHDEPDTAEAMLGELTTLLRGSFNQTRSSATTLEQELELVRAYLEIQKIRMGDRLRFTITTDPDCSHVEIPPLLIQPLVENAITHGIEAEAGPGTIGIEAKIGDGILEVSVTDSGPGPEATPTTPAARRNGHGSALANIRARLRSAYGEGASLKLLALTPKGTQALLRLPTGRTATPEAAEAS